MIAPSITNRTEKCCSVCRRKSPEGVHRFVFALPRLSAIVSLMCRRFVQQYTWRELADLYGLRQAPHHLDARYNITPTRTIDVVRLHHGRRELVPMRWGLVSTANPARVSFNARAETADDPMFDAAVKRSRCIVPASGYYQWKTINGAKQPFYFSAADGGVLSIAGLCDECQDRPATASPALLCTLIVTLANDFAARIHQRMPALLQPNEFASWLTGSAGTESLRPAPNDLLRVWRVSPRINSAGTNSDLSLIEPMRPPLC
jgi:putative SOS response-associated peptidase YedK